MLAITVHLLDGTYHADPSGNREADAPTAEWCPAPSRALAALVDAGDGPDGPGWEELRQLFAAPPPVVYADPAPHEQAILPTYALTAVTPSTIKRDVHGMAGRTSALVRRGARVSVADPVIVFLWEGIDIGSAGVEALAWRAARVGYLGCSDSQVRFTVSKSVDAELAPEGKAWRPVDSHDDTTGCVVVNVASAEHLDDLLYAHGLTDTRDRNSAQHRGQPRCWYRPPGDTPRRTSGGQTVWLEFEQPVSGRAAARASDGLKSALMKQFRADWGRDAPDWVHGHTARGGDYQLARFLVLPDCGHPHASGRLYGAAVWMPASASAGDAAQVRASLSRLRSFRMVGGGDVGLSLTDPLEGCKWAANPRRWEGPAQRWATVLPAANDHHGKPDVSAVIRWCRRAGLPDLLPGSVTVTRTPPLAGAVDLAPEETRRPGHTVTKQYAHVMFEFSEPVVGPVAIGGARSYGLGLCAPLSK